MCTSEYSDIGQEKAFSYLSPKLDLLLKKIFYRETNMDVLSDFIMRVKGLDPSDLAEVEILNREDGKNAAIWEEGALHFRAVLKSGQKVTFEILICSEQEVRQRISCNKASMVVGQLGANDYYYELLPTCCIAILQSNMFEDNYAHHRFGYYDKHNDVVFSNLEEIHTLELSKVEADDSITNIKDWLCFFNAKTPEEFQALGDKNPMIKKAVQTLAEISSDDKVRRSAEEREKELRDLRSD